MSITKQKGFVPIIVLVLIVLGIVGYFGYKDFHSTKDNSLENIPSMVASPVSIVTPKNTKPLTFKIGRFTFNTNNGYVYKDPKRTDFEPDVSDTKNYGKYGGECNRVGNIYSFVVNKNMPPRQDFPGFVSVKTWDENKVSFVNGKTQTSFQEFEQGLSNLKSGIGKPSINDVNFDLGEYLYCSGIYSIPILIQKVQTDKFDSVFYAEVLEGNGSYHSPSQKLIVHHDGNWLLFSESTSEREEDYTPYSSCHQMTDDNAAIKCTTQIWMGEFRDQNVIDNWINQTLASLKYND